MTTTIETYSYEFDSFPSIFTITTRPNDAAFYYAGVSQLNGQDEGAFTVDWTKFVTANNDGTITFTVGWFIDGETKNDGVGDTIEQQITLTLKNTPPPVDPAPDAHGFSTQEKQTGLDAAAFLFGNDASKVTITAISENSDKISYYQNGGVWKFDTSALDADVTVPITVTYTYKGQSITQTVNGFIDDLDGSGTVIHAGGFTAPEKTSNIDLNQLLFGSHENDVTIISVTETSDKTTVTQNGKDFFLATGDVPSDLNVPFTVTFSYNGKTYTETVNGLIDDDGATNPGNGTEHLHGTKGNNVIHGRDDLDSSIWGYQGNDRLYGGGGNDILNGNSGKDWLYGGDGKDRLFFNNQDVLTGGNDDDIFSRNGDKNAKPSYITDFGNGNDLLKIHRETYDLEGVEDHIVAGRHTTFQGEDYVLVRDHKLVVWVNADAFDF